MKGHRPQSRSYGNRTVPVQRIAAVLVTIACLFAPALARAEPVRIVALGDSLTAGFGLPVAEAFPTRLQAALKAKGIDATIANAGVSGDTASGGLERLSWSVPDGTDAVILELGANDALRGLDPTLTEKALDAILVKLAARHIPVLLAGMKAPPNMGADYAKRFDVEYNAAMAKYNAYVRTTLAPLSAQLKAAGAGSIKGDSQVH